MAITAVLAGVVAGVALRGGPSGDPGQLSEQARDLPAGVPLPALSDATADWGLGDFTMPAAGDMMAGGVAVADIDGDLDLDLIIANGDVAVLRWEQQNSRFAPPWFLGVTGAIGVTSTDIDRDGHPDLLVATATDEDVVFWGGAWPSLGEQPAQTVLPATGPSSALLGGELSGDGLIDIVRLGRGTPDGPEPDILWVASAGDAREFVAQDLPVPDRFTLAGELVDADGDGLLDIWLTRDIGWARGGDSLLSRQGDPQGAWVDVADELGLALKVDGMGITVADLNGDALLDAYVSDLGDNEVLLGAAGGGRFDPAVNTGAAHIRPQGAADGVVSSTWGTGAIDVNLDGVLDLVVSSGGFPTGSVSNKIDGTEVAVAEPPAVLLGIGGGAFVDVWLQMGVDLDIVARGMAVADFDGDGDDDFVVADRRGPVHLVRNDTVGPSVIVSSGTGCPQLAGAVLTVTGDQASYQRLIAPHGYASSHGAEVIVGNPSGADAEVSLVGPGWAAPPVTVGVDGEQRPRVTVDCDSSE